MGGGAPGAESMASVLNALKNNLPGTIEVINQILPSVAKVQAETDAAVAPLYAKSNAEVFKKYGPEMAAVGDAIERESALRSSQTELDVAKGSGKELVTLADELQRALDPEFYKNRASVALGNEKLLSGMDPNKLTGGEVAELESAIARQGGFANPKDTLNTVSNAMRFGERGAQKKRDFSNVLQGVAGTMPALRSGLSGMQIATGRSGGSGAEERVPQNVTGTGNNLWSMASGVMQGGTQLQAIQNSRRKDTLDKISQGVGIFGNLVGSVSGAF